MTRRMAAVAAAAVLVSCSSLPTVSGGVAFLEIIPPASLTVDVGKTLQFSARALDRSGAAVDVPVTWRTPDRTIAVSAGTGLVTGVSPGTGRVQAVVGEAPNQLASDYLTVTVRPVATPAPPR